MDVAVFLGNLPEYAVEIFKELAARAYPEAFEDDASTP